MSMNMGHADTKTDNNNYIDIDRDHIFEAVLAHLCRRGSSLDDLRADSDAVHAPRPSARGRSSCG